ncbi:MAG: nucleoside phosphorylase [Anaerolineales bacterium]|nr:nucleoside phosphorylase [Anaerolineales bacterium]
MTETFPNMSDKHNSTPAFSAADLMAYRRHRGTAPTYTPPETVVLCYQNNFFHEAHARYRTEKVDGFLGDLYLYKAKRGRIGVAGNFGIGAPVTAMIMEDLISYGVKQFIILGMAGGLQPELRPGHVIIAKRAIRDEGTSHHYVPPEKFAEASPTLTHHLSQSFHSDGIPHQLGCTWTTDAPYRETTAEVLQYQKEGVLTVEMEAAAMFSVGHALGAQVAAAYVVSDSIAKGHLEFNHFPERVVVTFNALLGAILNHRFV